MTEHRTLLMLDKHMHNLKKDCIRRQQRSASIALIVHSMRMHGSTRISIRVHADQVNPCATRPWNRDERRNGLAI